MTELQTPKGQLLNPDHWTHLDHRGPGRAPWVRHDSSHRPTAYMDNPFKKTVNTFKKLSGARSKAYQGMIPYKQGFRKTTRGYTAPVIPYRWGVYY